MTGRRRSARERALQYDAKNTMYLAYRVQALQRLHRPTFTIIKLKQVVGNELGYSTQQDKNLHTRWTRWMSGARPLSITEDEYRIAVNYLFDAGLWMHPDIIDTIDRFYPDSTFHSLSKFLRITSRTSETAALLEGVYNTYCFIYSQRGHIAAGHLKIEFDKESRALVTEETYDLVRNDGRSVATYTYDGYLVRTTHNFQILARERAEKHGDEPSEAQLTLLGAIHRQNGKAMEMDGVVFHNHRDQFFYLTRMLFRRVRDGESPQTLRLINPSNPSEISGLDGLSESDISRLTARLHEEVPNVWKL